MAVGKKFSVDFEQATEINGNTQILVHSEGQPVEKASVEQLGVALMDEDIIPNPDGSYPKMSVGFAENIVGDGSATSEEFSFRPTAGVNRNTLNNGAARIHTLKGNSVVWNSVRTGSGFSDEGLTQSIQEDGTIRISGTFIDANNRGFVNLYNTIRTQNIISGHKYALYDMFSNSKVTMYYVYGAFTGSVLNKDDIITATSDGILEGYIRISATANEVVDITINPLITDLTQMFGAGKEPDTIAEFYERMPVGVVTSDKNAGEIINGNYGAIKTTSFNQFNGTYAKVLGGVQYYLGGNYTSIGFATKEGGVIEAITTPTSSEVAGGSAPADRLYTPTQNGYIYANGDSICISLYWPTEYGNLYGTYKPYKPFERDLGGIITKYFTNGVMRSAGSAHDEIRFNSTEQRWEAVQRVDVRPYSAGDESNSAVTTDGTNTNYALATPNVKEMEEIPNFDYDVSDYGTEELIVVEGVESAPLSASIEYSPNVLAMLKNAPDIADDVDMLKSQVAALTAALTALTATNNE